MNEDSMRMMNQAGGGREQRVREDIREFREIFPEAAQDPGSIPQEVWEDVRRGRSLVGAYARYVSQASRQELEELRRGQAVERKNLDNQFRSTGTMRPADLDLGSVDAFLRGFQE